MLLQQRMVQYLSSLDLVSGFITQPPVHMCLCLTRLPDCINDKSERNDRGKCLGWSVASYDPAWAQGFSSRASHAVPQMGK